MLARLREFLDFLRKTRPSRMYRQAREIDNNFKNWHQLYRRCQTEDLLENRLNPTRIRYTDVSVNWSKYSKPLDTIFDYPDQGIFSLFVYHLPKELPKYPQSNSVSKLHSFVPEHCPEEKNYSHSQISTYKDKKKVKPKYKMPHLVKKEFKTLIYERSFLILPPKT